METNQTPADLFKGGIFYDTAVYGHSLTYAQLNELAPVKAEKSRVRLDGPLSLPNQLLGYKTVHEIARNGNFIAFAHERVLAAHKPNKAAGKALARLTGESCWDEDPPKGHVLIIEAI